MDYKLTVDIPGRQKGFKTQIKGLGTFENGQSYDITEEEEHKFREVNGHITPSNNVGLGESLMKCNIRGVKVTEAKPAPPKKDDPKKGDEK